MERKPDPYGKAIRNFAGITGVAASKRIDRPRRLAVTAGLPPSTGYRAIATLEAAGFLTRDLAGIYAPGPELWRVGMNAWGLGELHSRTEPVLNRLRRDARLTAFFGVISGRDLQIGPYSTGRGYDYLVPGGAGRYPIEDTADAVEGLVMRLTGSDGIDPGHNRFHVRAAPVMTGNDGARTVVGLLMRNGRNATGTQAAIADAARRLLQAGDE
jgi:hypothetical protein